MTTAITDDGRSLKPPTYRRADDRHPPCTPVSALQPCLPCRCLAQLRNKCMKRAQRHAHGTLLTTSPILPCNRLPTRSRKSPHSGSLHSQPLRRQGTDRQTAMQPTRQRQPYDTLQTSRASSLFLHGIAATESDVREGHPCPPVSISTPCGRRHARKVSTKRYGEFSENILRLAMTHKGALQRTKGDSTHDTGIPIAADIRRRP